MIPALLDDRPLGPGAATLYERLDRLVTDAHFRGGLPWTAAAESARPVVLAAFRLSAEIRGNVWMPRRVIRAGRAIVKGPRA